MSDSHGGGGGLPGLGLAHAINHQLHAGGYHTTARPFIITFAAINVLFLFLSPSQTARNWELVGFIAPLWATYILVYFAFKRFVQANKIAFLASQEYVLLELRMPRDTKKTPLAMEAILSNLHISSGEGTWYARIIQGKVRTWFTFEIVSLGGRIHFYVWTRATMRRGLEASFYAQYPDMEIVEAEDYSLIYDPTDHHNSMFGDEFIHTKDDAFPIKTYVDYGLDKAGAKPEEITDPLAQMLELMGSIGPKEQLWVQYTFRMSKGEKFHASHGPGYTWRDQGKDIIKGIREAAVKDAKTVNHEEEGAQYPTNLTPGQTDLVKAIERNTSKQGFDVGIRMIYTAPQDAYQGTMITFVLGTLFKPFSSETYNGFRPAARFDASFNDYPWEDPGGHHKHHLEHQLVDYYRRRAFFHEPYIGEWVTMSTEELATLFHVPGANVESPGLARIQSSTTGAPANLPT